MTRQIVLDTETTGKKTQDKHKIVEFGAVEIIDRKITGKTLHFYINPERDIPEEVIKIHGITNEKVKDAPIFKDVADQIIEFVKGAEILAHNADFDTKFLNHELEIAGRGKLWSYTQKVTDTLFLSRSLNPKDRKHSLDALCQKYEVDNSNREFHGALLDSQLLSEVYLKMTEGKTNLNIKNIIEQTDWVRPEIVRINDTHHLNLPSVSLTLEERIDDIQMKIFLATKSKNNELIESLQSQLTLFENQLSQQAIEKKNHNPVRKYSFSK